MFDDVLTVFKKKERAEDIIPIIGNYDLQKLLVAWPKAILKRVAVTEAAPAGFNERWGWLWRHVRWCEAELTDMAGIPAAKCVRLFNQAKGCRLIYPDGSVSTHAERYLSTVTLLATARLKTELAFAIEKAQKGRN